MRTYWGVSVRGAYFMDLRLKWLSNQFFKISKDVTFYNALPPMSPKVKIVF